MYLMVCFTLTGLEDSCDGPQDSSVHSDDSNDTDLTSEGKSEDIPSVKPQSSYVSRGKPLSLAKRGFPSKLRGGGAGEKYSVGKKTFSGSKKRGQTMPVRRGRGNGRGYRGYFGYQNVTLQVRVSFILQHDILCLHLVFATPLIK